MAALKLNQAVLTAFGIVVVISASGALLWYFSLEALSETKEKLEQEKLALAKLIDRSNFPSEQNIQALEEVIRKLEGDIKPVRQKLQDSVIYGENISGDAFQTRFARTKQQLLEACESAGILLPENFQFGFSFYATNTPSRDDTLALTQQLSLVERIVRILIEARVNRIISLRRTLVEKNLPPGVSLDVATGLVDATDIQGSNRDYIAPLPTNEKLRYTSLPFLIEFECNENSLRKIINDLSAPTPSAGQNPAPYFVIRAVEITTTDPNLRTLDFLRRVSTEQTTESERQVSSRQRNTASTNIAPIIVLGKELIQTRLRVDYIQPKEIPEIVPST